MHVAFSLCLQAFRALKTTVPHAQLTAESVQITTFERVLFFYDMHFTHAHHAPGGDGSKVESTVCVQTRALKQLVRFGCYLIYHHIHSFFFFFKSKQQLIHYDLLYYCGILFLSFAKDFSLNLQQEDRSFNKLSKNVKSTMHFCSCFFFSLHWYVPLQLLMRTVSESAEIQGFLLQPNRYIGRPNNLGRYKCL